jgi:hypothetical protein
VRSVPDGIAKCVEELQAFLDRQQGGPGRVVVPPQGNGVPASGSADGEPPPAAAADNPATEPEAPASGRRRRTYLQMCPACGNATAAFVDGCFKCFACGYTEC